MNALILLLALAADPATIEAPRAVISGDKIAIVGQIAELRADESQNAKSYKWVLRPQPLSLKNAAKDGSAIFISHDSAEIFEIELIVSSPNGDLDIQIGTLEVKGSSATHAAVMAAELEPEQQVVASRQASPSLAETISLVQQLKELQLLLAPPPPPQPVGMMAPQMGMPQMGMPQMGMPQVTTLDMMGHHGATGGRVGWPEGVTEIGKRVESRDRSHEGRIIAGTFRGVANRIKVGTFSGKDPWVEAQRTSRELLGNAYPLWESFFTELNQFIGNWKQQGQLPNPEASVWFLERAAESLSRL